MGTTCEVKLYDKSRSRAEYVAQSVAKEVKRLELKYSRYREDSFLSQINNGGLGGVQLDDESSSLMDYVSGCYEASGGLFDVTTGSLRKIWNLHSGTIPTEVEISELLAQIGWRYVDWNKPLLRFLKAGIELDLGGVVKEYAVDRGVDLCLKAGIRHGLINLGGDIRVIGPGPNGEPWPVHIKNPRDPQEYACTIEMTSGALATSGDYERCIEIEGKRFGHIYNPLTGWPVDFMASVSVVSSQCIVAGSLATIGMLKGSEGVEWLKESGQPHLWISVDGSRGGSFG